MGIKKAPEGANENLYHHCKRKPAKSQITQYTRRASFEKKPNRQDEILEFMDGKSRLTAREIVKGLGYTDMNAVRPRLTELLIEGRIVAVGKERDKVTNRLVAVYEVKEVEQ